MRNTSSVRSYSDNTESARQTGPPAPRPASDPPEAQATRRAPDAPEAQTRIARRAYATAAQMPCGEPWWWGRANLLAHREFSLPGHLKACAQRVSAVIAGYSRGWYNGNACKRLRNRVSCASALIDPPQDEV